MHLDPGVNLPALDNIKASGLLHKLKQITDRLQANQLQVSNPMEQEEIMRELAGFMSAVRARRWAKVRKERLLRMRTKHGVRLNQAKTFHCQSGKYELFTTKPSRPAANPRGSSRTRTNLSEVLDADLRPTQASRVSPGNQTNPSKMLDTDFASKRRANSRRDISRHLKK